MIKLLSGLFSLFVYFSCGTVLFEAAILGYLYYKEIPNPERNQAAIRVLYGLEKTELAKDIIVDSLAPPPQSYRQIRQYRLKITLDQDLRESSLGAGVDDLQYIEEAFDERRRRFKRLSESFQDSYAKLQGAASDASIIEMRNTIAALRPEQAAEQIIRMLDMSRDTGDPQLRNDMVTILKSLPTGTQKKVLAEFKDDDKVPYMLEMLEQIRLGMPEISVVRETRQELQNFRNRIDSPSGAP